MRFARASGILLHPSSLPGPHGSGDLGPAAWHFVDWLATAGQKLWQVLPLGGIGPGNSPYMSSSAFAGNVLLIDLGALHESGWLTAQEVAFEPLHGAGTLSHQRVRFASVIPLRMGRLALAARRFFAQAQAADLADYQAFCSAEAGWLDDYALFMALADHYGWTPWCEWDGALARREPGALAAAAAVHAERIAFWKFCQWCFFRQWHRLKAYANARGIGIIGDAPIFIAYQSAEVWARQDLFELDAQGRCAVVAGVPPDAFSATGQRWGNPLYRWSAHASEGFAWWTERLRRTFALVDRVRIDHFRGFADYWEIPAAEPTAMAGHWRPGPGAALFQAVERALGPQPIIAEDLGIITPEVRALRRQLALPGMSILHFAFGGDSANLYLPHNHEPDSVVYPGTHDNDTTQGWWASASEAERRHVHAYLGAEGRELGPEIHWELIRLACASVADTAIYALQDVLGLPGADRMNFPGFGEGYWEWRFTWDQVRPEHAQRLADWCRLYRRDGLRLNEHAF